MQTYENGPIYHSDLSLTALPSLALIFKGNQRLRCLYGVNHTAFPGWATPKLLRCNPTGTHPLLCPTPGSPQAGGRPVHPAPALSLPAAALLGLRPAALRKSPSLSCLPPAEPEAEEHTCHGGVFVGEGRRRWDRMGRCANLPWGAQMPSRGSGYPHFIDSRSCIPRIPTIPRETAAKPIGVSKNGTVGNTQKIEFLLLK